MKKFISVAVILTASLSAPAFAQSQTQPRDALESARERDACNGFEVTSARYEPGPKLAVTCSDQDRDAMREARARDACDGFEIIRARYEPGPKLVVECSTGVLLAGAGSGAAGAAGAGAAATNFVPLLGALGPALGVGAAAAAAAALSSGSSSSDTQ